MKIIRQQETVRSDIRTESVLLVQGVLVGVAAGIVGVAYRYGIEVAESWVAQATEWVARSPWYVVPLALAGVVLAWAAGFLIRYEPQAGGSGIPQVTAEANGDLVTRPVRVILTKCVGGALSALGGLSLGREGPSIQLGAMAAKWAGERLGAATVHRRYLLTAGAGAGLAVAFNAPLAGVLFALEEIHKQVSKKLVIACFSASIAADAIAQYVFGLRPIFVLPPISAPALSAYGGLVLLGVVLGAGGALYMHVMDRCYRLYARWNPYIVWRAVPVFVLATGLYLIAPEWLGSGHRWVETAATVPTGWAFLLWLFAGKLVFSLLSFTSGVPGGIFLPILVQGALLGALVAQCVPSADLPLFVVVGMAGYLCAVVRSPLTSMLLLVEMTQSLQCFLPLAVVCLVAYMVANACGKPPVYTYLLANLLRRERRTPLARAEAETELTAVIETDSDLVGRRIRDIAWGRFVLVREIRRAGESPVPNGDAVLRAGDELVLVMPAACVAAFLQRFRTHDASGFDKPSSDCIQ